MEGLNVNIMLVVAAIAAAIKAVDGYRKGMVKEIVSLVSLVVLCVVAALLAYGATSYNDGRIFNVVVIVVLLLILITVHRLLSVVFFSAKLATMLPVVHFVDKLLGVVFGVFEIVLLLWTLYAFLMMMDAGALRQAVLSYTRENAVLTWIYEHNYLARGISIFLDRFQVLPLLQLLEGLSL